jgi:ABC-2 type transport system permease protein
MRSFIVFFQKEWMELIRTKKFFILLCIFALFGMMGPVVARYMQEIIVMAVGDKMPLIVPPTTWVDSWGQFYSNLSQMGGMCDIPIYGKCFW